MNQNILYTSNISIGYKTKKAIVQIAQNLNINLQLGKLITIVGQNGIGKSTLLRTLTGIQPPLLGTIYLNDKPLVNYKTNDLSQQLSLVLTEKLPPSNLTIYELISLGRQPYTNWIGKLSEIDIQKIDHAIQLTGIQDFVHRKHDEVSDGQLQKALVARALVQDTPLIILDEPTTHLDLVNKVSLFKLLKQLSHTTQKCILCATHDIDLAIQLSDEMIVMTPKSVAQNTPCNFIENGTFNTIFKDENIVFDSEKGRFIFEIV